MSFTDTKVESPEHSDQEGDNFEDAQDAVKKAAPAMSRQRSTASTRSLTDRSSAKNSPMQRPSSTSSNLSNHSETPSADPPRSVPDDEALEDLKTPRPKEFAEQAMESPQKEAPAAAEKAAAPVTSEATDATKATETATEASEPATLDMPLTTPTTAKPTSATFQEVALSADDTVDQQEERGRRLSLDSPTSPKSMASAASTSKSRSTSRVPSVSDKQNSTTSTSSFSLTGWVPSKQSVSTAPLPPKKMSTAWGWLSRKKTAPENVPQTQTAGHRHNSSASMPLGKPDLKLQRIDTETLPAKDQLKERFKLARMKEEAGINTDQISETARSSIASGTQEGQESHSRPTSEAERDIQSPASAVSVADSASSAVAEPAKRGHKARTASMAQSINLDPNLAPGTVAGLNQGPSIMADPEVPVDWDLWQSVVYEGPAAVAKTSAAELSRSIASGIPNPIRGVVWQVLAQSKDDELEQKYHELIVKGTDKELPSSNDPLSAKSHSSNDATKENVRSSASSVRSEASAVTSPVATNGQDTDADAAKSQAERQKKKKEEQAAMKKLEKTIRKDLGARSNYSKYFAAKEMQDDLFGVCKAYALYDEAVGYAQGLNFIVMPLLFNMPPEEAFCLLVRLMYHYRLRETYIQDMPGLHRHLYQFERLLEETDTKLCRHLSRKGITPSLYATQWFITLFAYKFPLQLVLRVYDLILSEGLESAILKFGIALMEKNSEKLLEIQDMSALKTFLNERLFDVYIDSSPSSHSILEQGFFGSSGGSEKDVYRADLLVQDACAVSIPAETLKAYADEYDSKTKAEHDRQAEVDELRANVTAQTARIKSLEERVTKSDTDHVQITQEMIRSRMENEELKTSTAEQLAEIEKLKKLVADAPEQVETSLKEEMERIMARNTEVQSQNRVLEEQMAEMEKSLVETKLQFAQVNVDYETLKQKWSDLRRALGD